MKREQKSLFSYRGMFKEESNRKEDNKQMLMKEDKATLNGFQPSSELKRCQSCFKLCNSDDLYYEYKCDRYICVDHFLGCNFQERTFQLPCGHLQDISDVKIFTKDFCRKCRKQYPKSGFKFQKECLSCQIQTHDKKNALSRLDKQKQKKQSFGRLREQSIKESKFEKVNDQEVQKAKNLLDTERRKLEEDKEQLKKQKLRMNSKIKEQVSQEYKTEISAKNNEIEKLKQQLKVSTYIKNQLKGLVLANDRDVECPICFQNFDLEGKKPLMICWQQHLICQDCFNRRWTGRICPLCREPIERSKALVSRQKSRSLQIEKIVTTKYENKVKELRKRQYDESLPLLAWSVSNQQIQTDALVEEAKPAKRGRQKKQTTEKPPKEQAKKGSKKSPSPKVKLEPKSQSPLSLKKDEKVQTQDRRPSFLYSQRNPQHSTIVSKHITEMLKRRGERLNTSNSKPKPSDHTNFHPNFTK